MTLNSISWEYKIYFKFLKELRNPLNKPRFYDSICSRLLRISLLIVFLDFYFFKINFISQTNMDPFEIPFSSRMHFFLNKHFVLKHFLIHYEVVHCFIISSPSSLYTLLQILPPFPPSSSLPSFLFARRHYCSRNKKWFFDSNPKQIYFALLAKFNNM